MRSVAVGVEKMRLARCYVSNECGDFQLKRSFGIMYADYADDDANFILRESKPYKSQSSILGLEGGLARDR